MANHRGHDDLPGAKRWPAAFLVASCCAVLAACGGNDGDPAVATSAVQPTGATAMQQASAAPAGALMGRTTVVLNAPESPPPLPASETPSNQPGPADAARIVALARDADGTVRLKQRDGTVRVVSPEGKLAIHSGAGSAGRAGDVPHSVMVAVDAASKVHVVDPDACVARTISPDGRVASTPLPAPTSGACARASR